MPKSVSNTLDASAFGRKRQLNEAPRVSLQHFLCSVLQLYLARYS